MSDSPTVTGSDECQIPIPVASEENVVRAVWSQHLDGKSLKKGFFKQEGTSVMRHTYMGTEVCRARGRAIVPGNAEVRYKGLAIIRVAKFRTVGSDVIDSRAIYCGHAHVSHGLAPQGEPGEPLFDEPSSMMNLDDRLRELKKATQVLLDPDPLNENWTGSLVEPLPD
jgi:hypothetical protein